MTPIITICYIKVHLLQNKERCSNLAVVLLRTTTTAAAATRHTATTTSAAATDTHTNAPAAIAGCCTEHTEAYI